MKMQTTEGREAELKQDALDGLRMRLRGPLFLPGEAGHEESRSVWNAMIDRKPAVVARCRGVADVITCVQFARDHDMLLSIKGGGHNIAGLAAADGALMLDMSLMRGVWVDSQGKVAHAQAGCLLGDVDRETQVHGLASVLGFVSATGIAGLTLGGGFGYLTRRWGWTSDNVLGMNVVTADARLVRASSDENADLFWGLRGGGGNFGVVTGIDYALYPVGPEVVGGVVAWPAGEAPKVLELYRTLAEKAPPELTLVALMRPAPPAPWLPKDWHGKPIIALLACCSGRPEDGEKLVAPIKAYSSPVGDVLVRRPYTQLQKILDATQPKGPRLSRPQLSAGPLGGRGYAPRGPALRRSQNARGPTIGSGAPAAATLSRSPSPVTSTSAPPAIASARIRRSDASRTSNGIAGASRTTSPWARRNASTSSIRPGAIFSLRASTRRSSPSTVSPTTSW